MKHGTANAWLLVACLWAGCACAQAPGDDPAGGRALRAYRSTTQRMLVSCSDVIAPRHFIRTTAAALGEYRACAARALEDSGTRLEAVVRTMAMADSVRALREYHAAFVRALAGVQPQQGESGSAYDERQTYLFHRLAHAWARFELAETVAQ